MPVTGEIACRRAPPRLTIGDMRLHLMAGMAALALVGACGGKVVYEPSGATGTGGTGGVATSGPFTVTNTSTGDFTSTNSTTGTFSSTSTGPVDPCSSGADCTLCGEFGSCAECEGNNHPEGAKLYNDFVECVVCRACFTACDGASSGCPGAPTMKDPCDSGGSGACGGG